MELQDRVFVAMLATLFLAVLVLERCARCKLPASLKPPPVGEWNVKDINVPHHRPHDAWIDDVAYIDADDAAAGSFA